MSVVEAVELHIPALENSLKMFVHGPQDKHVSHKIREEGIWEPFETTLVLARLNAGDVFVDVGANIGYFTVLAASRVGSEGRVYAFEPDPANFQLLERNCEHNTLTACVQLVEAGLSSADSAGSLYLSSDNFGDHQIYSTDSGRQQLEITLLQGANYLRDQFENYRLERIDLIKVDTQGSEFDVMQGLMPLLLELAIAPDILIELTPFSLRQSGASGRELIELLAGLELDFWIVDHIEHCLVRSSAKELAQWCDDVDTVPGDEGFMNIYLGENMGLHRF